MRVGVVDPGTTRELRRAVLRPHLAPGDPLPGDDLTGGVHIAACDDDGTVVGTCYAFPEPCPWLANAADAWHLRQMATAPGRQRQGIGAAVLAAAVAYVCAEGAPLIWCHARERAVSFYARHGFRPYGEIFIDAAFIDAAFIDAAQPIPHLRMYRELRIAPASSEG